MALISKDIFLYGHIDTDTEDRLIKDGNYRESYHMRGSEATNSNLGGLESMTGHEYVENNALTDDDFILSNGCPYTERKAIVYFVHNSEGDHSIWYYDTQQKTHTLIVQDPKLNFQLGRIIFARVINNILYWTDGYFESYELDGNGNWQFNPPRMINIDKAIAGYAVIDEALLDIIKAPPAKELLPEYITTGQQSNIVYGQVYQFAVQWGYENGENSVWSVISQVPVPIKQEFVQGRNYFEPYEENALLINAPTGSEQVRYIRVAVRPGNNAPFQAFYEADKQSESIPDNSTVSVSYDGTISGKTIPLEEGIRNYDRVPQVADTLEVLSSVNQLSFANYVEGYDPVDISGSEAGYYITEIPDQIYGRSTLRYQSFIAPTRRIELSQPFPQISYSNNYGYATGDVILFEIPLEISSGVTQSVSIYYEITQSFIDSISGLSSPNKYLATINSMGQFISDELDNRGVPNTVTPIVSVTGVLTITQNTPITFPRIFNQGIRDAGMYNANKPYKTLKTGVLHEYGIQYYDRAMRSGDVLTNDSYKVYVNFPSQEDTSSFVDPRSPYYCRALFRGTHQPPIWAKHYQILEKKTRVLNFQQRTGVSITADGSLYKISLDTYYEGVWGAKINHQISEGDVFRIKNAKGEDVQAGITGLPDYAYEYIEGTVVRYDPVGGDDQGEAIWVTLFDYSSVIRYTNSFVVEVYTPDREYLDEPYYEIGEVYDILEPYTDQRRHGGKSYTGEVTVAAGAGTFVFEVEGDVRPIILGNPSTAYPITFSYPSGVDFITTVSAVVYNQLTNISTVTVVDASSGDPYETYSFNTGSPAPGETYTIAHNYGDVYLRQRATNNNPGWNNGNWRYWVEDPHISDYYVSNSNDIGKLGVVNKQGGRKTQTVSLIHGGSYIDRTGINNICRFDFSLSNVVDLDEQFGVIRWIGMNGYTLKVLQDRKETSIYIQRSTQVDGDGNVSVTSLSNKTWGGVNPYESLYGTIHPLSVKVVAGQMFYYDYYSSRFIRSLTNGQQDICENDFLFVSGASNITDQIKAFGLENVQVLSAIDEQNKEYQFFYKNEEEEFYSGAVFNYSQSRWKTRLAWAPTCAENFGDQLLYFKGKDPYLANNGDQLNFLGVQYPCSVKSVFNDNFYIVKRLLALGVSAYPSIAQAVVVIPENNNYPELMTTMDSNLFQLYENGLWSEYTMNENDPSFATAELARFNGIEMRGYSASHNFSYSGTEKFVIIRYRVNYIPSESVQ